jgi:hypothetical protein
MKELDDILAVMRLAAKHDLQDCIGYSFDDGDVSFYVPCSDVFGWGCADAEELPIENLPLLERAIDDCLAIDPVCGMLSGMELYCARVRNLRPQGPAYPENQELWPLFDACGPERAIDHGNPSEPGVYQDRMKERRRQEYEKLKQEFEP